MLFYSRLTPILFLVLGWWYEPKRVQAAIYLLFNNLSTFLLLPVCILFIYSSLDSLSLFLLQVSNVLVGGLFYVCRVLTLLVRILICMVHLWLPRAHAEGPVSGSMRAQRACFRA